MKANIPPGKYLLAVSGGVDSMVLLDILSKMRDTELVVAHFNHGIRVDSMLDEELVKNAAKKYGLNVEIGHGNLDQKTSEEKARQARYKFLSGVKSNYEAEAIITAHHQDDLIETAFINLIRGSGYRGLISIMNNPDVLRPLLKYTKKDIRKYANDNDVFWREDSTNEDPTYLRNHIRKSIMPNLTANNREILLENIDKIAKNSPELSELNATISQLILKDDEIDRKAFCLLPNEVGNEAIAYLLNQKKLKNIDKKTIQRLNIVIRTAKPGTDHDVKGKTKLHLEKATAYFTS